MRAQVKVIAETARSWRALRREIMAANKWFLRDLYRTLETAGTNSLRDAQAAVYSAVGAAYGIEEDEQDALAFLLRLNLELAADEFDGEPIRAPGIPASITNPAELRTTDCIRPQ